MLNYYYDKEADVFYFSQGKPSSKDETIEVESDVLLHINPRTKKVRGFTLFNASRQHSVRTGKTPLPIEFVAAR